MEIAFLYPTAIYAVCLFLLLVYPDNSKAVYVSDRFKIFDTFILLKTERFKNAPSGFYYFVKAIGNSCVFILLSLVVYKFYVIHILKAFKTIDDKFELGPELDPLGLAASITILIVAFYWHERKEYVDRWKYLADLYNKMLEIDSESHRDYIFRSLIHDIHRMQMWGHDTFQILFHQELRSYLNKDDDHRVVLTNIELEECLDKIENKYVDRFYRLRNKH